MVWLTQLKKYETKIDVKAYIARLFIDLEEASANEKRKSGWTDSISAYVVQTHLMPFLRARRRIILAIASTVGVLSLVAVFTIEASTSIPNLLPSSNDIQRFLELRTEFSSDTFCDACLPVLKTYKK